MRNHTPHGASALTTFSDTGFVHPADALLECSDLRTPQIRSVDREFRYTFTAIQDPLTLCLGAKSTVI